MKTAAEPEAPRLAKRVAALAGCSRRDAELYIQGGWVRVDGTVVETPQFRVGEQQRVELDPAARLDLLRPVTLLLHKPAGPIDLRDLLVPEQRSASDTAGVMPLPQHFSRLTALLPLPALASGLAVFSQETGVIRRLTEDAGLLEQELLADIEGELDAKAVARLSHGLRYRGYALPRIKVSWQSERRLRFALKGIAPDLVPWMCEQVGGRVIAMRRLRIGRIPLAGLPSGQWRYLRPLERF